MEPVGTDLPEKMRVSSATGPAVAGSTEAIVPLMVLASSLLVHISFLQQPRVIVLRARAALTQSFTFLERG